MKKIKSLKTGLIKRNFSFAKMAAKVAKDYYFSEKEAIYAKLADGLEKRALYLTDELGHLKGSFLKAGQMLSQFAQDQLPPDVSKILSQLQANTSYLDWNVIKNQVPDSILQALTIEEEAFAAASIGQVHLAHDEKRQYALKIQYKNMDKMIDTDLKILRLLLKMAGVTRKDLDTRPLFHQIKKMLVQEMDYKKELELMQRYKKFSAEHYIVPEAYPKFSTEKVLCSEFIHAQKVTDVMNNAGFDDKKKLAIDFFKLFLKEIFDWKLMQTDAHFGNYQIKDNKWVLLDFGATKELTDNESRLYQNLIEQLFNGDKESIFKSVDEFNIIDMQKSDDVLFWDYICLIRRPLSPKGFNWQGTDIAGEIFKMSKQLRSHIALRNSENINLFIDRKISGLYTMFKTVGIDLNLNDAYIEFKKDRS